MRPSDLPDHDAPAPHPGSRRAARTRAAVAFAVAAAVLAVGIARYWPFATDDAFISLRYSARLLDGQGLTWNDGEYVEGYSNLLWVLACAGVSALGPDLLCSARLLGIGCTLAACWLMAARFARTSTSAALVAAAFAAAAPVPVWAIGGLEAPLLVLCITGGLLGAERGVVDGHVRPRALLAAGGWFAAACLTRPDAPLFVGCAALGVLLAAWRPAGPRAAVRAAALLVAIPGAAVLLQLGFRLAYYGDYLPNTARVKLASGEAIAIAGRAYLQAATAVLAPLLVPAAAGAAVGLWSGPARGHVTGWIAAVLLWGDYTVRVGGDIFASWRAVMPGLVPAALLVGVLLQRLARAGRPGRALAWATVAAVVGLLRHEAVTDPQTERATWELWEFDNREIGLVLREHFAARQPLLALDAAGALPFYSELPGLDMLGLCDATIARDQHRGGAGSAFEAAHRRGSPDYIMSRQPDLMFFNKPVPDDPSGLLLVAHPEFTASYRCVWFRCGDRIRERPPGRTVEGELIAPLWVRLEGRVGVARARDEVVVPAWLVGSYRHRAGLSTTPPADPAARPQWLLDIAAADAWGHKRCCARPVDGELVLEVRQPGEFTLRGLRLEPGVWALPDAPPGCVLELRGPPGAAPLPRGEGGWTVAAGADDLVLALRVDAAVALPLHVGDLRLRRLP